MTIIEERFYNAVISFCNRISDRLAVKVDWEQRRYEIAKDMFTATYFGGNNGSPSYWLEGDTEYPKEMAKNAVTYADALIEELKKNQ